MSNKKEDIGVSRRQFTKGMALTGAGLLGNLGASLDAFATQEDKIQAARKKYVNTLSKSPHQVDEARYKRFSGQNLAVNVVSRELGIGWDMAMLKNMLNNVMQGKSSSTIDAGSKENARAEVAMFLSALQSNMYFGTHGGGCENRGVLNWNDVGDLVDHGPPPFYPPHPGPTSSAAADLTQKVKLMARLSGADLVGICKIDRKWVYADTQLNFHSPDEPILKPLVFESAAKPFEDEDRLIIPDDTQYAIVMAYSTNRRLYQTSPSILSMAASNMGYTRMGMSSMQMAEFIRVMGYNAIPCKNSTALTVPMAVDAGLGEVGRNSILITPEYGPLVRLEKVLTNMPLIADKPIEFGVQEFCKECKKCARQCPSKSITNGDKTWEGPSVCNNPATFKYHNDLEKCLRYWVESGTECSNCVAVCPFTKGAMWTHDATRWAIDKARFLDPIWLNLDDSFGFGEHRDNSEIWSSDIGTYGIDPDMLKKWHGS